MLIIFLIALVGTSFFTPQLFRLVLGAFVCFVLIHPEGQGVKNALAWLYSDGITIMAQKVTE